MLDLGAVGQEELYRALDLIVATLTRNLVRFGDAPPVVTRAQPTPLQQHAFERLGIAIAP